MRRRFLSSVKSISGEGDYQSDYFTIEALEDGLTANLSINACEYCIDGDGAWKTLTADTNTEAINTGHTLSFRGNLTPDSTNGIGTFTISKNCSVKGNIMSLLFGDNGKYNFSLAGYDYAFYKLFYEQRTIIDASNLILPALTLSLRCYSYMFQNTSITKTPSLPAETLYQHCYSYMFYNCTKLTTITNLDSITLADQCYSYMFYGCTSLVKAVDILPAMTMKTQCYHNMFRSCKVMTTAPILPALDLVSNCYYCMFYGCSKLNYVKALFLTTPSSTVTQSWLKDVASAGTFVKNKNATWDVVGGNGIPEGWTVQNYVENNLITFTINGSEYQAEEGMTYRDWLLSSYNTSNQVINDNFGVKASNMVLFSYIIFDASNNYVKNETAGYPILEETITDGYKFTLTFEPM